MANTNKASSKKQDSAIGERWYPAWWQEENVGSGWERVKAAALRDWEQTRRDFHAGGHELSQNVGDTIRQATGSEPIPANDAPNPAKVIDVLTEAEIPIGYGYGARSHYAQRFHDWDTVVEAELRMEWEGGHPDSRWEEIKDRVKYGFEYKH